MKIKKLNQRGDTIIEVMIAMAVLGLVLVISFQTANRNTLTLEDSQERGVALKLAESQIESMKAFDVPSTGEAGLNELFDVHKAPDSLFCMVNGSITPNKSTDGPGSNSCIFGIDSLTADVGTEPAFNVRVKSEDMPGGLGKKFTVTVNWDSILGNGTTVNGKTNQDKVQMEYGLYQP